MKLRACYLTPHPPIIIPEIGMSECDICGDTIIGMEKIADEIASLRPDNIMVISPHGPLYSETMTVITEEYLSGNFARFGHPEIVQDHINNLNFGQSLCRSALDSGISTLMYDKGIEYDYKLDHGTMVPLYFITKKYKDFKLIPVNYGFLSRERLVKFGNLISDLIERGNESFVVIASGDLSHSLKDRGPYSYTEEGPIFDEEVLHFISTGDYERLFKLDRFTLENAHQCGYNSILTLLGVLSRYDYSSELYSYEGPFGVGYATAAFKISKLRSETENSDDPYVLLAKMSIDSFVNNGTLMKIPDNTPDELLKNRSGVFVSIHRNGELRGCIGTISPTKECLAMEIIHNAISASSYDPRFYPVTADEIDSLSISVDVLSPSEPIDDICELDPKKYGVIVTKGNRRGLLLPNLDGVETAKQQVDIALNKAGIGRQESFSMERFEVIRHE